MTHTLRRSQKRRVAKLKATMTGREWQTNREKRAPVKAPVPRFTLPDVATLDKRDSKSHDRAMSAGRFRLRQSVTRVSHRDVDQTFMIVG